jgi:hypothetical protein
MDYNEYYDSKGNQYKSLKDARKYLRKTLREDPVKVQPFAGTFDKYIRRVATLADGTIRYTYYGLHN